MKKRLVLLITCVAVVAALTAMLGAQEQVSQQQVTAIQVLFNAYPELKNRDVRLSVNESPVGFHFLVTDVAATDHGLVRLAEPDRLLTADIAFDSDNAVRRLSARGQLTSALKNNRLLDRIRTARVTGADLDALVLSESPDFGPDAQQRLTDAEPWRWLEGIVGPITIQSVRPIRIDASNTTEHEYGFLWVITASAQNGGRPKTFRLTYEPFHGRLVRIDLQ